MKRTVAPCAVVLAAALCAVAHAQTDPTKPAAAWLAGQPKPQGVPGQDAPVSDSGPANASIQVMGAGRRFVVIDGVVVKPGETFNGAKLLAIGPSGAQWQREGAKEQYSMSPAVNKKVLAGPGAPPSKKQKKGNGEG